MNTATQRYASWVIRKRWWIICLTILFVVLSAIGAKRLEFNLDGRIFFSANNPQLQALDELEKTYTKDENVFIAIAPKNGNVFTKDTLAVVEEMTKRCWQIPYSNRVDSITNFQHTWAKGDELIVEDLVEDAEKLSNEDIEKVKKIALEEPLLLNRLISPSGHVTGINVNLIKPGKSIKEVPEIANFTKEIIDEFKADHKNLDFYLTGDIMVDNTFGEAGENDAKTLIPLMFLVLIVIMGITLRSAIGTISTLVILIFSIITGMGLAGWLKISLNPSSANAPTIILTLAVADSIHLLVSIFGRMRSGYTKNDAIVESMRINMQPVFLTSLTTWIGFLSMNFCDSPPFRDLGNIVAIGVAAAYVYSILLLPALVAVLPIKISPIQKEKVKNDTIYGTIGKYTIKHRRALGFILLIGVAVLSVGITRIELNDDFIKYFDKRFEFRRASDFVMDNLTGLITIEYSLDSGRENGINDPEFLNVVDRFKEWYEKQPNVVNVRALTDTVKRLNKNMHGDDSTYYRIPDDKELIAQYLLLYEMSLPYGLDLNNEINVKKSSIRFVATLRDVSAKEMREVDRNAQAWLKTNAPANMHTYGSSISYIWSHISERTIDSMLNASFGALVLISAILIIALRSFKYGLLSLIPNITPAFMAFGFWGFVEGRVGLAVSVIVAFTLGIVVDDTVHFMSKYLRARREENMSPNEAILYTFNTVGKAMWVTTITLVAGFLILSLSGFRVNAEMGLMAAVTIIFAFILDFFLLPILLLKVDKPMLEAN